MKLSKDPITSGSVYIMNRMGQVLMSQLAIHGQVLVSCRLDGKLDKQAPHSGSLHFRVGMWEIPVGGIPVSFFNSPGKIP